MTDTDHRASENQSQSQPLQARSQAYSELHSPEQFESWRESLLATPTPAPVMTEVGRVTEVGDGVAAAAAFVFIELAVCFFQNAAHLVVGFCFDKAGAAHGADS